MLDSVLAIGAETGVVTIEEIARKLSISPELAERLLFELERAGYIVNASSCQTPCGACPARGGCRLMRGPRLWTFTEKGARARGRRAETL